MDAYWCHFDDGNRITTEKSIYWIPNNAVDFLLTALCYIGLFGSCLYMSLVPLSWWNFKVFCHFFYICIWKWKLDLLSMFQQFFKLEWFVVSCWALFYMINWAKEALRYFLTRACLYALLAWYLYGVSKYSWQTVFS